MNTHVYFETSEQVHVSHLDANNIQTHGHYVVRYNILELQ